MTGTPGPGQYKEVSVDLIKPRDGQSKYWLF
jgi:hypothetical protein